MSQDVVCECGAGEHGHPLDGVASSRDSAAALPRSTVNFAPEAERPPAQSTSRQSAPAVTARRWFTGSGGSSYRRPTASCRQTVSEYTNVPDIHDSKAGNRIA